MMNKEETFGWKKFIKELKSCKNFKKNEFV